MAAGHYSSHYRQIDPRWDAVHTRAEGVTIACQDLFDNRYVDRSEFYQDLLLPRGLRYIFGGVLRQDEVEEVVIAFNHQLGRPAFSAEKRQCMSSLFPFLVSWLKQLRHTDRLRQAAWAGETGLAALEQGVVLLNQARKVLYLNPAAERCFPRVGNSARRGVLGDRHLEDTIRQDSTAVIPPVCYSSHIAARQPTSSISCRYRKPVTATAYCCRASAVRQSWRHTPIALTGKD